MNLTASVRYFFLVTIVYIGTLWAWLQYSVSEIFSYWDEVLSLLFIPYLIIYCKKPILKKNRKLLILLMLFSVSGLAGNFLNKYTTTTIAFSDLFLNIKFFMLLLAVACIFEKYGVEKYGDKIVKHINFLSLVLIVLFVIDRLVTIFPVYEVRFGIKSEQLIFSHPTYCASAVFYLLMLRTLFIKSKSQKDIIVDVALFLIILFTLRFKAIATVIMFLAYYLYVTNRTAKKIKWIIITITLIAISLISYDQVYGYFLSDYATRYPRGAILITSFKIIKDYFPIGTGFGTFGSYLSGVHYSPVYSEYKINNLSGMTFDNYSAISDQYWPMISGQSGAFGLLIMIFIWKNFFTMIMENKGGANATLLAGVGSFIYLLVSSTSESAICNPACMPFAIIIGLTYAENIFLNKSAA